MPSLPDQSMVNLGKISNKFMIQYVLYLTLISCHYSAVQTASGPTEKLFSVAVFPHVWRPIVNERVRKITAGIRLDDQVMETHIFGKWQKLVSKLKSCNQYNTVWHGGKCFIVIIKHNKDLRKDHLLRNVPETHFVEKCGSSIIKARIRSVVRVFW